MPARLLAPAALLRPWALNRTRQQDAASRSPQLAACRRRAAACRPLSATLCAAAPPPPRPYRTQLIASVAAAPPPRPPPPPSLSSTIVVSLPAWLALALTFFMATFAGLCVMVVSALLPTLREVAQSARSVKVACDGVVDACDEVEKLAVLMAADIKCTRRNRMRISACKLRPARVQVGRRGHQQAAADARACAAHASATGHHGGA